MIKFDASLRKASIFFAIPSTLVKISGFEITHSTVYDNKVFEFFLELFLMKFGQ